MVRCHVLPIRGSAPSFAPSPVHCLCWWWLLWWCVTAVTVAVVIVGIPACRIMRSVLRRNGGLNVFVRGSSQRSRLPCPWFVFLSVLLLLLLLP